MTSCGDVTSIPRRTAAQVFAATWGGTPLTKANLAKNDSLLANELRNYRAPLRVEQIDAAAESLGFELPAKTIQQLLERYSEVGGMEQYLHSTEETVGGPVEKVFWAELVEIDPLAAEIDAICRSSS